MGCRPQLSEASQAAVLCIRHSALTEVCINRAVDDRCMKWAHRLVCQSLHPRLTAIESLLQVAIFQQPSRFFSLRLPPVQT
jgi:hypothetical protein